MAEGKIVEDKTGRFKFEETYMEGHRGSLAAIEDEREVRDKLWHDMTDNDVIVDIGSEFGQFTLSAASQVKPHGMVYSFESDPKLFKKLRNNIKLNKWHDIVSAHHRKIDDIDSLDKFISELSLAPEKIKWIKIDVDGNELKVVKGALETIKRYHPMMLVHCHSNWEPIYDLLPKPSTAVSRVDTPLQSGQLYLVRT